MKKYFGCDTSLSPCFSVAIALNTVQSDIFASALGWIFDKRNIWQCDLEVAVKQSAESQKCFNQFHVKNGRKSAC